MEPSCQQYGLHPLETQLYKEGVRSYLSLPLMNDDGEIIGGAHFGSKRAYALNRGHLLIFGKVVNALTGSVLRDRSHDRTEMDIYASWARTLADESPGPVILTDGEGRIIESNKAARDLFTGGGVIEGRPLQTVFQAYFENYDCKTIASFFNRDDDMQLSGRKKDRWKVNSEAIWESGRQLGYSVMLLRDKARKR